MEFNLHYPLTNFHEDTHNHFNLHSSHFLLESDHMVSDSYTMGLKDKDFNFSLRRQTISLILQFSGGFDPLLSYLAVNYLDRFFSNQGMPTESKPWVVRLLALTCVSLASKMMKTEVKTTDFQCGEGFIFDSQTIDRMEKLILGALKWRMRSITPFAFIDFFIALFKHKDPTLGKTLRARAMEIIFKCQYEIKLLEFKPSIIAASALLSASHELFPIQFPTFRKSISSSSFVNKEKLTRCVKEMEGIVMQGYESVFENNVGGGVVSISSSDTPVNVLDHHWSTSTSTSTTTGTTLTGGTEAEERERKRQKKIGGSGGGGRALVQLSQFHLC